MWGRFIRHSPLFFFDDRAGRQRRAVGHLYDVMNTALMGSGQDFWLSGSSLLGLYRDGDILRGDYDVDFSALTPSYPALVEALSTLPSSMRLEDTSYRHLGPKLYDHKHGWEGDVYFYTPNGEGLDYCLRTPYPADRVPLPRDLIFPLQQVEFLGQVTKAPRDIEGYLRFKYGYIEADARRDLTSGYYVKA